MDSSHERDTRSVRENLLKNAGTFGIHFHGYGFHVKVLLFNILAGRSYLKISVPKHINCRDHMLSGHRENVNFISNEFICPMLELDI